MRRSEIAMIAAREIGVRVRAKSFPILTGLLVVGILAIGVIGRLADSGGDDATVVGIAGEVPAGLADTVEEVAGRLDLDVTVEAVDNDGSEGDGEDGSEGEGDGEGGDAADARRALEDGDADAVVVGDERQVLYDGEVDEELQAVVQQAWSSAEIRQSLTDAGLSDTEADEVVSAAPLGAGSVDEDDEDTGLAILTGTVAAILLFMSLQMFGSYVLVGVVEEKSSAVVELLLVRVRSDQLLAGKVIGIGAVALLQFVLAVIAGLVALVISGTEVPGDIWSALPLTLVWFLGGYALYSTLFALAGSLVSRQEDAQAAAAPILTVLIGSYILIYMFGFVPDSGASRVLSLIPPIAPFLMPMRMAAGAASIVEIAVSLALLVGATYAAWKVASRIYEQVLLRRGSRIPWREALALARHD